MISISTRTFDLLGSIVVDELPEDSRIDVLSRRVSKTRTLDGGVTIEDRGFSHGDRALSVVMEATEVARESLSYLIRNYGELVVCTRNGAFLTAPASFALRRDEFTLDFEVKSVLSEEGL